MPRGVKEKIFNTRYALTQGILEQEAELFDGLAKVRNTSGGISLKNTLKKGIECRMGTCK